MTDLREYAEIKRAYANGNAVEAADNSLEPINPATLAEMPPPRQWLINDWVPMLRVTALYGAGGEGKTLLGQMLATSAAIAAPWLGLPVQRCKSLLLFCEDDQEEMHRRQADINAYLGAASPTSARCTGCRGSATTIC